MSPEQAWKKAVETVEQDYTNNAVEAIDSDTELYIKELFDQLRRKYKHNLTQ